MKQFPLFLILLFSITAALAQQPSLSSPEGGVPVQRDSLDKPPITAYKIFTVTGDTTYVDTSLTIQKDYRFNYLRRDIFELVPFANVGQTYNKLAHHFKDKNLLPQFGARAKHFQFMEAQGIAYYEVPTPLTELYFKTVPEQGQTLDAFFTVNTSPRLNFSIAYKGLRSLGKYQHVLTSTGHFRSTINYNTLNNRYYLKAHFVSQDLLSQENGGLNEIALEQYINKEPEFEDRSLLEVKFENAENVLYGKRFFLDHNYILVPGNENVISLEHVLNFSDKKYIFRQASPEDFFGESLRNTNLNDESKLRHSNNVVGLTYKNDLLGKLAVKAGHSYYNYGYNSVLILEDDVVNNRLIGENYSAGAEYTNAYGPVSLYGDAMINVAGDYSGHYLTAGLNYQLDPLNHFNVEINSNERAPNFNFLLNQSDYLNYNWQPDFDNVSTQVFSAKLLSPLIATLEGSISRIINYTYFSRNDEGFVKPFQHDQTLNYLRLKAQREFFLGKFALNNTLMYQKVTEGGDVLNVPDFVTRNSLYYRDHWFQRALYVQTGFTFKYFTPYEMDAYDPVLAEFFVQNQAEYGGYPVVDFFFNGRVQQTRIFFKLEHVNSLLTGNNNFSAPDHPYRDFIVRFGLVWNFFL